MTIYLLVKEGEVTGWTLTREFADKVLVPGEKIVKMVEEHA